MLLPTLSITKPTTILCILLALLPSTGTDWVEPQASESQSWLGLGRGLHHPPQRPGPVQGEGVGCGQRAEAAELLGGGGRGPHTGEGTGGPP